MLQVFEQASDFEGSQKISCTDTESFFFIGTEGMNVACVHVKECMCIEHTLQVVAGADMAGQKSLDVKITSKDMHTFRWVPRASEPCRPCLCHYCTERRAI